MLLGIMVSFFVTPGQRRKKEAVDALRSPASHQRDDFRPKIQPAMENKTWDDLIWVNHLFFGLATTSPA
jgi:hypothetical protein